VASRLGAFALGFATGALTVIGFQRLREYTESEDYERLADSVQDHLHELEARISRDGEQAAPKPRGTKAKKSA
jgi:hypothetical protein